jgi:septal ring factor EnvC (AmiA/AmiB activator)
MDLALGSLSFILLFLVVIGKYLVSMRVQQLRQKVIEVEVAARSARGKLKQIETQSGQAGREVKTKERKRQSLEKQIAKYKQELGELRG